MDRSIRARLRRGDFAAIVPNAERQAEIDAWLKSKPPAGATKAFDGDPAMGNLGTGFEVRTPGGPITLIIEPMEKVNLVLISDGYGGFLIHTAHPF